jgi:hypothetical protein
LADDFPTVEMKNGIDRWWRTIAHGGFNPEKQFDFGTIKKIKP